MTRLRRLVRLPVRYVHRGRHRVARGELSTSERLAVDRFWARVESLTPTMLLPALPVPQPVSPAVTAEALHDWAVA